MCSEKSTRVQVTVGYFAEGYAKADQKLEPNVLNAALNRCDRF
jgi:hypothetical protein